MQGGPVEVLLRDDKEGYLSISSDELLAQLRSGEPGWEDKVPPRVAKLIKERKFFSYKETSA